MKKGLHIIRALYPVEPDPLPPVDTYYGDASYFTASPLYDAKAAVYRRSKKNMTDGGIMIILAIDPGTTESGYCLWNGREILDVGKLPNEEILEVIASVYGVKQNGNTDVYMYYEKISPRGQRVGSSTFDTVFWCGRFVQFAEMLRMELNGIPRNELVKHYPIIHKSKANPKPPKVDAQIKQCLTDRFLRIQKNKRGASFWGPLENEVRLSEKNGKTDRWQAFALAVMMYDVITEAEEEKLT